MLALADLCHGGWLYRGSELGDREEDRFHPGGEGPGT
jgi:hypothetical protein